MRIVSNINDFVLEKGIGNEVILKEYKGWDRDLVIPSILGITTIQNGCFRNNDFIRSIVIPEGVDWILEYAFSGCTKLETVILPDSIIEIGTSAFMNCVSLDFINLENVVSINAEAFRNCLRLGSVNLPEIKFIQDNAFRGCSSLERVILPYYKSVQISFDSFSDTAFFENALKDSTDGNVYSCNHLLSGHFCHTPLCKIKDGTIDIAEEAFSGNEHISNVILPVESLQKIGRNAFAECKNLKHILLVKPQEPLVRLTVKVMFGDAAPTLAYPAPAPARTLTPAEVLTVYVPLLYALAAKEAVDRIHARAIIMAMIFFIVLVFFIAILLFKCCGCG